MEVVSVTAGASSYEVVVGAGLLESLGSRIAHLVRGPRCLVVADENSGRLFGETIMRSLHAAGFEPALATIPAGEASKSFAQLQKICDEMTAAGLDRSSFVVALGGGVVGDLAGFAAAIYHRGIPYVQVPTTLLAQVDSSIGGKTAIDTSFGKNLVGAFHQPVLVLADVDTLGTLPAREFNQGFAEIIKHAHHRGPDALRRVAVENLMRAIGCCPELVRRNVEIKAAIVGRDERDVTGERAILNFGHTVGHAIEKAGGYSHFLHGEAVSLGIVIACELSVQKAGLTETEREKVVAMLAAFDLPTRLPSDFPREQILPALQADKKFERGAVRFVVTERLGSARLTTDVRLEDIAAAVAKLSS